MTTRIKTIEYVFPTDVATLASATRRDFTAQTLYIPDAIATNPFVSITLWMYVAGANTSATSLTAPVLGIKIGATAFENTTLPNPAANSGETEAWIFQKDCTSYFNTNWSGTSQSVQVGCQFTGPVTANHSPKLIITYKYDDTVTTQIKTIRIPVESTLANLTTSWQTLGGTTAIPAVGTGGAYLPENVSARRQVWVELFGNEISNATTDFTLQARVNGGSAYSWFFSEQALQSARWAYGHIDITAENLSAARSLEAISVGVTTRCGTPGGIICVTYEFNASTSTVIFNSLLIGAVDTAGWVGGTGSSDNDAWGRRINIQEPDTITLKESGVCLFFVTNANFTFNVSIGNQAYQSYSCVSRGNNVHAGQSSLVHRLDAGGRAGSAGMTLGRGFNDYLIRFYSTTDGAGWNLSGFIILNYTSGKATDGVGVHAQSVNILLSQNLDDDETVSFTPSRQAAFEGDGRYYIISTLFYVPFTTDNSTSWGFTLNAKRLSGEMEGQGWEPIYVGSNTAANENHNQTVWAAARKPFQRWYRDPDPDRMDLSRASRTYRWDSGIASYAALSLWYTFHNIKKQFGGYVDGYGDSTSLTDLNVRAYRSYDDSLIYNDLNPNSDGWFTGSWYDDTEKIYFAVREDDNHVGRSNDDFV